MTHLWFVTQSGSCVTIEGLSRFAGYRLGEQHRFVFSGDLRSDFSISGRWMWTWACSGPECPTQGRTTNLVLQVRVSAAGEPTIEVPSGAFDMETVFTGALERISSSTEFPESN
ncbi:MAG: hypothetical protein ACRDFR_08975 [Candidatus Limnocylindria bacterium]